MIFRNLLAHSHRAVAAAVFAVLLVLERAESLGGEPAGTLKRRWTRRYVDADG